GAEIDLAAIDRGGAVGMEREEGVDLAPVEALAERRRLRRRGARRPEREAHDERAAARQKIAPRGEEVIRHRRHPVMATVWPASADEATGALLAPPHPPAAGPSCGRPRRAPPVQYVPEHLSTMSPAFTPGGGEGRREVGRRAELRQRALGQSCYF